MIIPLLKDNHTYRNITCGDCGLVYKVPLNCGDRLCPICKKPNYYRLLRLYLPVIRKIKTSNLKLITLTHCNFKYLTRSSVRQIASDYRQLRETAFWNKSVKGSLAVVECKHKNDKVGWNIHIHILVDSSFIPVGRLSKVWASITGHSYIVDIRRGRSNRNSVFHLLKYFLKTPVIQGNNIIQLRQDYNDAFRRSRTLITSGSLYNVIAEDIVYHFSCPKCGGQNWLFDWDLFTLEKNAVKVKAGVG